MSLHVRAATTFLVVAERERLSTPVHPFENCLADCTHRKSCQCNDKELLQSLPLKTVSDVSMHEMLKVGGFVSS